MPPSIGHWLDWLMTDVLPLNRNRPRGLAFHVRYEKAGQWLDGPVVPWNAEAIRVEASLRLAVPARQRSMFSLRFPGLDPIPADSLRCESGDRHRLAFTFPVPAFAATGELLWKNRPIGKVNVPVLAAEEFLASLSASLPTVFVKLGTQFVAANAFVAAQCGGLAASLVIRSPFPLAPLADLGLAVSFRNDRTGQDHFVPVSLSGAQLAANEATATAVLPRVRRSSGAWSVAWHAGGRELARQTIHAMHTRRFERSLQVVDSRFLLADKLGRTRLVKQLPHGERGSFGPCYLLASAEPGIAAIAHLAIHAAGSRADFPPLSVDVLVTDGIAMVSAGVFDANERTGATGFELRVKNRVLGFAPLSPVPSATITAEGGFRPPPDFVWTGVADEELNERLNRLMDEV